MQAWMDAMAKACWQGALLVGAVWALLAVWKSPGAAVRTWMWLLAGAKFLLALAFVIELPVLVAGVAAPSGSGGSQPETSVAFSYGAAAASRMDWAPVAYWLWSLGVALIVAKAVVDHRTLARIVRRASPAPASVAELWGDIAQGRRIRARVCFSQDAPVPFAFGLFRPVVVLPTRLAERLSAAELRMVLAHEAAHVARRDVLASLYVFVCHALFFFHPLVCLLRREWRTEREAACDQWAIDATRALPQEYAAMLIKVSSGAERAPALALSAVHSYRTLERRITEMNRNNNKKSGRALIAAFAALISVAALPFALVQRRPVQPAGITGTNSPQVKVTQRRSRATTAAQATGVGVAAPVAMAGVAPTIVEGQATAGQLPGVPVAVRATSVSGQAGGVAIAVPQAASSVTGVPTGVSAPQAVRATSVDGRAVSGGVTIPGRGSQNVTGVETGPRGRPIKVSGQVAGATTADVTGELQLPRKADSLNYEQGQSQPSSVTIVIKDRLSGQGTGPERRVTLEMKEMEINAFIKSLSQASGVKMTTKGVSSSMRLNVQIENATLGDVMGTVAKPFGLEWRLNDDGSITVQPFRHPGTAR